MLGLKASAQLPRPARRSYIEQSSFTVSAISTFETSGWDNALFRLGDQLAAWPPRRAIAAPLIVHEQIWLPRLVEQLSLPIPAPTRIGTPACGYPWHWSVVP